MRIKNFKTFESSSKNWGDMAKNLLSGYSNILKQSNDLQSQIEQVKVLIIDLSDISDQTILEEQMFVKVSDKVKTSIEKVTDSWSNKQWDQITTDKDVFHTVKKLGLSNHYFERDAYIKYLQINSFMKLAQNFNKMWFGIDIIFRNCQGGHSLDFGKFSDDDRIKRNEILEIFNEIKLGLQSRGWSINMRGWGDDYIFDAVGGFSFDIIKEVDPTEANVWYKNNFQDEKG
jgi:hypothetical protein